MTISLIPLSLVGVRATARAPTRWGRPERPRSSTTRSILGRTVLIPLLLAACADQDRDERRLGHLGASSPYASSPLHLRLEMARVVRASEAVPMKLVLENRGSEAVDVELTGRPPAFDFRVLTESGREVWRRLDGVAVSLVLQPLTVGPGDTLEFTEHWHQRDQNGRPVPLGSYRAQASLPVVEPTEGWGSDFVEFRIVP